MRISLDHASQCLATQTPREYLQQLAVVSQALQRARGGPAVKGKARDTEEAQATLQELRKILDPVPVSDG